MRSIRPKNTSPAFSCSRYGRIFCHPGGFHRNISSCRTNLSPRRHTSSENSPFFFGHQAAWVFSSGWQSTRPSPAGSGSWSTWWCCCWCRWWRTSCPGRQNYINKISKPWAEQTTVLILTCSYCDRTWCCVMTGDRWGRVRLWHCVMCDALTWLRYQDDRARQGRAELRRLRRDTTQSLDWIILNIRRASRL